MATTWRHVGASDVEPRRNRAGELALSVDHVRQKVVATAATMPLLKPSDHLAEPAEQLPSRRESAAMSVHAVLGRMRLRHSKHAGASAQEFSRTRAWLLAGVFGLLSLSLVLIGLSTGLDRPSTPSAVVPPVLGPPAPNAGPRPVPAAREATKPAAPKPERADPPAAAKGTGQSPAGPGRSYQDDMDTAGRVVGGEPWSAFIPLRSSK
ncbi:MAG: hypothetical protein M3Z25_04535 [Actinomycetota bacterium]|nr:hypothetical protein [Actinomycetota bacterium]